MCESMDVTLDIRGLSFSYRDRPVLSGIDLGVPAGTTLGLIGPNGGGKTTLLKLILGLLRPTSGTIRVAGLDPRQARAAGDVVGYVPQSPVVPDRFPISTRQLVRTGLAGKAGLFKTPDRPDLDRVEHLLDQLQLKDLADTPAFELSGGQLQRAMIARAVAAKPKLVLLDEPTVGIDRRGQQQFVDLLTRLRAELGLTVVLVSHDLRVVASLCDRIACLANTIHYHDVPHRVPADLVYQMFACDVAASGLAERCGDPACDGHHAATLNFPNRQ